MLSDEIISSVFKVYKTLVVILLSSLQQQQRRRQDEILSIMSYNVYVLCSVTSGGQVPESIILISVVF